MPSSGLPSAGLAISPGSERIAALFRSLPMPVIGRLHKGRYVLDLRCLEDETILVRQLCAT